ncbi:MAG TPA: hypothetical protein DCE42_21350 [Myxococcales bacterium]|nr:hypothetical protein [Deltaproteobacteria bacterium]MBU53428.1 hypothetical protein [Deltaproteobacteria bacterium]HAA57326.1 hypothetical protein [Myxococcales bacterium]
MQPFEIFLMRRRDFLEMIKPYRSFFSPLDSKNDTDVHLNSTTDLLYPNNKPLHQILLVRGKAEQQPNSSRKL